MSVLRSRRGALRAVLKSCIGRPGRTQERGGRELWLVVSLTRVVEGDAPHHPVPGSNPEPSYTIRRLFKAPTALDSTDGAKNWWKSTYPKRRRVGVLATAVLLFERCTTEKTVVVEGRPAPKKKQKLTHNCPIPSHLTSAQGKGG